MQDEDPVGCPLTPAEREARDAAVLASRDAMGVPQRVEQLPRDFDAALPFAGIRIPAGGAGELRLVSERACYPKRLYVPSDLARGMNVTNIVILNRGQEVPFFDGRDRAAELFDGVQVDGKPRDVPYGILPKVLADAGEAIVLRVKNSTAEDRPFAAMLAVDYSLTPGT